jgi:hypothetical protein
MGTDNSNNIGYFFAWGFQWDKIRDKIPVPGFINKQYCLKMAARMVTNQRLDLKR